jgi:hypothetical protein
MADEHNTPIKTGLKRDLPYSPNDISPSIKQSEKVARTNTLSSSPLWKYHMSLPIRKETCDDGDFTISNFANGMRFAYVLGIKL